MHKGFQSRDNPRMGPDALCEKTFNVLLKWTLFLAGPHIQAIQITCQLCSNVDFKDSWAHQILQRAHKISNGQLKLEICMYLNGIWAIGPF